MLKLSMVGNIFVLFLAGEFKLFVNFDTPQR